MIPNAITAATASPSSTSIGSDSRICGLIWRISDAQLAGTRYSTPRPLGTSMWAR